MNGICLLPSLNRPRRLEEFFKAYRKAEWSIPGWVLIDKGDFISRQQEYQALDIPSNWKIVQTNEITMGGKCREMWGEYKDMDYVMLLNDDHLPITERGDLRIVSQINGTNLIGTNDGPSPDKPWNAPNRICGATTWSGKVLREVGYMFPKGLSHLFIDDLWANLAGRAGCAQVLMDVCVHHNHAYITKEEDDTHKKVNSQESWQQDFDAFQRWLKEDAAADSKKLVALQNKQGVMVCTPSQDGNSSLDFGVGLMDGSNALNHHNIYFEFARVDGSSLLPHARNSLVNMFLESKCQRLLFIDSDQGYNRNHILHLLNSNRPIVAGVTPHKRFPINLNFEPLEQDKHFFPELHNKGPDEFFKFAKAKGDVKGEIEVNRAGTGFMMIDRSVFQIMIDSGEVPKYKAFDDRADVYHHEFFKMGSADELYRGEDWFFCQLAKKLNIPIYISSFVCPSHKGTYTWRVDESKRLA